MNLTAREQASLSILRTGETVNWVGVTTLRDWSASPLRRRTHLDVVLITHPRDEDDLWRIFPWASQLTRDECLALTRCLRPGFAEIIDAPLLSVGLMFLPLYAADIITSSPTASLRVVEEGLRTAAETGARIVCLGGLTGALTLYGELIDQSAQKLGMRVATGHAATAVSIVRLLERAAHDAGVSTEASNCALIGAGSVGAAVARLLAARTARLRRLVLVERPNRRKRVERLVEELRQCGLDAAWELTSDDGTLPPDSSCYRSRFLLSAISTPYVIDVHRVATGTILIDDSQPYCWDRAAAWSRCEERGDILPCDAGLVDCASIGYRAFFPFDFADYGDDGSRVAWSCVTEGLLCHLEPSLTATVGEPQIEDLLAYDAAFDRRGLRIPPLQCAARVLPMDRLAPVVKAFEHES